MRKRIYISVPVDLLTKEQAKSLRAEVAGLLDPEAQEAVFNDAAIDGPQRTWTHLSKAMLLIGGCDAVIFSTGWDFWPGLTCFVELEAALRSGKQCLYTYRDSAGKLCLLKMGHCGGPEKREEDL